VGENKEIFIEKCK